MNIKDTTTFGPVQILMLKGEQGEPGKPTDEQVTSAVNAWLDEHPEATTTVQDGSIAAEKFTEDLYNDLFIGKNEIAEAAYSPDYSDKVNTSFNFSREQILTGKTLKTIKALTVRLKAGLFAEYNRRVTGVYLRLSDVDEGVGTVFNITSNTTISTESDFLIFAINYEISENQYFEIYITAYNPTSSRACYRAVSQTNLPPELENTAAIQVLWYVNEMWVGGTGSLYFYDYSATYYQQKAQTPVGLIAALTTRVDALDARVTASSGNGLTFEPDFEPFSVAEGLVATKVGSVCNISGSIMPTSDVVVSSASVVASFDGTEFISPRGIYAPAYIIGMGAVPKLAFWIVGGIISLSTISGDPVTIPAGTRIVLNTTWLE